MSRQSARGAGTGEIASGAGLASRDAADRALRILETHLEPVRWDGPMLAASPGRGAWRITDNNSLFQINVFPGLFTSGRSAATTRRDPEMELTWLKNLEGPMLERLASGRVSSLPCGVWSETGVRFPQPGGAGRSISWAWCARTATPGLFSGNARAMPTGRIRTTWPGGSPISAQHSALPVRRP